jgi:hypothetical protein
MKKYKIQKYKIAKAPMSETILKEVTWNPGQSQKWGPHLTSKAIYLYGF